ncbi:MAG: AmmeMemoRadiSam system radical SAM enzyme [Candidatus Izemoplasmatales bacterium]
MVEAMLYDKLPDGSVRCGVCPHRCTIAEGRRGVCGVRENRGGTLDALNYGLTAAAAVDPIEKKPLFHFLPGTRIYSFATVGCNLRCAWCQNWDLSQNPKPARPIAGEPVEPAEHVRRALAAGCPSIAYTYAEPTIFVEYALATMKLAREAGLRNVWVTNGYMTPETLAAILPWLDAANVDVKGPASRVYEQYCGAAAEPVLDVVGAMRAAGVHVEATTLVVPGVNDSDADLKAVADGLVRTAGPAIPWHVTRFFPAWKMFATPPTPLATLRRAEAIGRAAGLTTIHLGNV